MSNAPSPAPLHVLYRSDTLLAVDKPQGLIVHGDGTGTPTLTDRVCDLLAGAYTPDDLKHIQALQRLDRETTGIVLFSLAKATQPAYDRMIAERHLEKTYLAIACGRIPWTERELTWPIGRDRHDARRMVTSRTGKPARTYAAVRDQRRVGGQWLTLLDVRLGTGRKHQIRVHLARAGYPLLGDALYGRPDSRGLMLHARRLAFCDPVGGKDIVIEAPVPQRMRALFPRELS